MKKIARLLAPLALIGAVAFGLTACAPEPIALSSDTVIIDVRTADEFNSGHLEGALNLDVQSVYFDELAQELPLDGDYIIYCRSGNRSAAAIDRLEAMGFTSLTDAGGLQAAATATGLEIVE